MVNRIGGVGGQQNLAQQLLRPVMSRKLQNNPTSFTTAVPGNAQAAPSGAANSASTNPASTGVLGDVNGDGVRDRSDADAMLNYLFRGGAQPIAMDQADVNGDGTVTVSDTVALYALINEDAAAAAAEPEPVLGDVNGDGVQNESDAKELLSYLFNGGSEPAQMKQADVNGDGQVNISDAISIYRNSASQQGNIASAPAAPKDVSALNGNVLLPSVAAAVKAYSQP